MRCSKWIVWMLALLLAALPAALAENLDEEIVFSDAVEEAVPEEGEFLLGEDDNLVNGYADFILNCSLDDWGNIVIGEPCFPDANFRKYVSENIDTDGDGKLSEAERQAVLSINVREMQIASLKGIQLFPNLSELDCFRNQLTSLDLTGNRGLTLVICSYNQLTALDVSRNMSLDILECGDNQIAALDVSQNAELTELICSGNRLTSLDLIRNAKLEWFNCADNQLTSLDVSRNTALTHLTVSGNQLAALDVRANTALKGLGCSKNALTALDVSRNTQLTDLDCSENKLTSLDVSGNAALKNLDCRDNQLTSLKVAGDAALKFLDCQYNQLTALDLSHSGNLTSLWCDYNQISALDFSGCGSALKQALLNDPQFTRFYIEDVLLEGVLTLDGNGFSLWFDDTATLTIDGRTVYEPAPIEQPPEKVQISSCKITVKAQVYTGKALKPSVTVKYNGTKLVKGTDYTVSYKNNTKVGTATVTVKGIGNYTGSKKATFKINPKPTTLSKVTPGKKKLTVTWKKQTKQVSGYQIQYGTKKDFSNAKKVTVKGAKTVKKVIKSLKAKKYYYVRIRTYKTVSGKKYYSSWSNYKKIKTK